MVVIQFMNNAFIFIIRLIISAFCGFAIGFERQSRYKEAGPRTHMIVALTACLMMIISKYSFDDVLSEYIKLDPARVAAAIVTAISFLGAGVIFTRNENVIGLTTAAGLWSTVGIGMSIGAGFIAIGIFVTLFIVLILYTSGSKTFSLLSNRRQDEYMVMSVDKEKTIEILKDELNFNPDSSLTNTGIILNYIDKKIEEEGIIIKKSKINISDNVLNIDYNLSLPSNYKAYELYSKLRKVPSFVILEFGDYNFF